MSGSTHRWTRCGVFLAGMLLSLGVGAALPPGDQQPPSLTRGLQLFARQCALCHGALGHADGPASDLLRPRPRDFGEARFKIVSTTNSLPHDEDLLLVLRAGMPGSAMPAFDSMPRRDLLDLVATVRHFVLQGRIDQMLAEGAPTREAAVEQALELLDPGARLRLPPEPPRTAGGLLRGSEVFAHDCAHCHDADGSGRSRGDLRDTRGDALWARDFTQGVFLGGAGGADLARRVRLGMPGTPMPAMRLTDQQLWDVVHYVQTLIEPGAQERVRQRRQTLVARRVNDQLDSHAHLADWDQAPEVFVPLMPLVWRRQRIEGVSVSALHDGRHLALRLSWVDPSDDQGQGASQLDDGAAVELSPGLDPPFFGMGSAGDPVTILEWRAAWQRELPNGWSSRPVLSPAVPPGGDATLAPSESGPGGRAAAHWPVRAAAASGPGKLHPWVGPAADVRARGLRTADGWSVIFYRRLVDADGVSLARPGQTVSVAFALWDGGQGDTGGRKSISIWQHLLLEE